MIDYASIAIHITWKEYVKFLELIDKEIPPETEKMVVFFENLRIEYFPNSSLLRIKNSLHKFFNRSLAEIQIDGNYNDFRFSDLYTVCGFFSEWYLQRDLKDFKLSTRFETGVNIDSGAYKAMKIIERYDSFQVGNTIVDFETIEPYGNRIQKPTTRKSFLSDYQIKFYDKSVESNLSHQNLLRYEMVYGQLRKIRAVLGVDDEITLDTLCKWENWKLLGDNLIDTYDKIKKLPLINGEKLTIDEINQLHAYTNKKLKADLSSNLTRHYYTQYLRECRAVYDRVSISRDNFHEVIRTKVVEKLKFLCTN